MGGSGAGSNVSGVLQLTKQLSSPTTSTAIENPQFNYCWARRKTGVLSFIPAFLFSCLLEAAQHGSAKPVAVATGKLRDGQYFLLLARSS